MSEQVARIALDADAPAALRAAIAAADVQVIVLEGVFDADAPAELVDLVRSAPQPVVTAVRGTATGAGAVALFAGDLVVASTDAVIGPLGSSTWFADRRATSTLERRVGAARAARMLLTGERLRGDQAEQLGLVDAVATADRLGRAVDALVAAVLAHPSPRAVKAHLAGAEIPVPASPTPEPAPARRLEWTDRDAVDGVVVERAGAAARITLDRPKVLNAFDAAMSARLSSVIRSFTRDESLRALLITGSGRAFSAGADIGSSLSGDAANTVEEQLRSIANPMITALRTMRVPVVSAVNGPAVGVGCSVALSSDLVVASDTASFQLAFSNVGLSMDGGATASVLARGGFTRASRMALLAAPVPARDALAAGLIDQVVYPDELQATADALVARLAAGPSRSYAATKRMLNDRAFAGLGDVLDREGTTFGELVRTPDFTEAVASFLERRAPSFRGFGDGGQ
jgi:2-(1,2-epoxy-1,2-dihydrophenyl)acetyl-CoA isomerase